MSYQTILWDVQEKIATLTLSRPEKLNALSNRMADEILDAFTRIQDDDNIRVLIITGNGRAFSAGADINERFLQRAEKKKRGELWGEVMLGYTEKCCLTLANISKPTIAAINGIAFGFGATLLLGCDMRIASGEAKIGYGFVRMGVTPEFGSSYFLPRLIGLAKACELVLTGKTIDAREAFTIGLVNQVVSGEVLMDVTRKLALDLAEGPPIATQLAKQLLYQGLNTDLKTQLRLESLSLDTCRGTLDHEESVKAFFEKRKPVYIGK